MVRLRLSAIESDKAKVEKAIDHQFKHLQLLMNDYLVATEDEPMQQTIGKMLLNRNQKLSTAESCTGGFIAHLITSIPGSSAYFEGSIVSYSYEAKENLLHVKNKTLIDDGAVSEAVVIEMAKGLLAQLKTDYAIAVSGIMGPDGGTHDKPSGMVWVAVVNNSAILTQKFQFRFDRMKNIQLTAVNALNLLRKFILSQDK